jgi:hypothetical protein
VSTERLAFADILQNQNSAVEAPMDLLPMNRPPCQ